MPNEFTLIEAREVREGRYIVIDDEPCRVTSISLSKPGKHGEAKARIEAISLFTDKKKTLLSPAGHRVKVPVIKKENASIVADMGGNKAQFMDMETFETYDIDVPEEFRGQIEAGKEAEIQAVMGRRMIMRIK